ncbi:hypothetical protein M885DRAFT_481355 [Pelagophyceae sp. CCMP2097]|nr:hypothetical protein M885DRAFT_481355 [Pelagophyceae sp. CCMP2097]
MAPMLRGVLCLAAVAGTAAFAVPKRAGAALRGNAAPRTEARTQLSMVPLAELVPAARYVASVPILYALMSINEYVTHRYYQHAEFNKSPVLRGIAKLFFGPLGKEVPNIRGGGHVEHHAETLDDMTLKTDPRWRGTSVAKSLDGDLFRGTGFTWPVAFLMTVQMLPTTLPIFKFVLGFSLPATMAFLIPGMLIHTMVWNALHPNMHALPDVTIKEGPPSWVFAGLRNTAYFKFLYTNHEGHHVVGGRGNYNVACPGVDHVVGTFIPEAKWRPRVSSTYASHHGEDIDLEQQIKNHVAREKFGLAAPVPEKVRELSNV